MPPLQVLRSLNTQLPSRPRATRKQERPGPERFLWICFQDQVISAAHKGSQEAALPPAMVGPVLAGPGQLGAQAPDSRGFFLPLPYPAPGPSSVLDSQAGSCPDMRPTVQGHLDGPEWSGVTLGTSSRALNYQHPPLT